jgi:hypothetical protein
MLIFALWGSAVIWLLFDFSVRLIGNLVFGMSCSSCLLVQLGGGEF